MNNKTESLSVNQICQEFKVSPSVVYKWRFQGYLEEIKVPGGGRALFFTRKSVEETKQRLLDMPKALIEPKAHLFQGALAADLFCDFDEGLTLIEIVKKRKVEPATVRHFYEEYKRDLEEDHAEKIAEKKRNLALIQAAEQRRQDELTLRQEAQEERKRLIEERRIAKELARKARADGDPSAAKEEEEIEKEEEKEASLPFNLAQRLPVA